MNNQLMVMVILAIIVLTIFSFLWHKGQKKIVITALGFLIHKAEVYFLAGENQAKIDFVLRRIASFVPAYLRRLWNEEWIKKQVKLILLQVEKELGYQSKIESVISDTKKDIMQNVDAYVENTVLGTTNYFTSKLLTASVNGDTNLVDNNQINLINAEIQEKIKSGLDLKAFANIKTDFDGNTEGNAGVEIKKSF